ARQRDAARDGGAPDRVPGDGPGTGGADRNVAAVRAPASAGAGGRRPGHDPEGRAGPHLRDRAGRAAPGRGLAGRAAQEEPAWREQGTGDWLDRLVTSL